MSARFVYQRCSSSYESNGRPQRRTRSRLSAETALVSGHSTSTARPPTNTASPNPGVFTTREAASGSSSRWITTRSSHQSAAHQPLDSRAHHGSAPSKQLLRPATLSDSRSRRVPGSSDMNARASPRGCPRACYSTRIPEMARLMTSCWICSVPSKMSWILASRCQRSTGYSRV